METVQNPIRDYKKWLLFNNSLSDHKHLYDLYNAVKDVKVANESRCERISENGLTRYLITSNSFSEQLDVNEEDRQQLMAYLKKHYFHTDNVDEWFREKQGSHDKLNNHEYLSGKAPLFTNADVAAVTPHPKESKYYSLKLFFGILGYMVLLLVLTITFLENPLEAAFYCGVFLMVLLLFSGLQWIVKGLTVGIIKGNAVRITEKQYPLIFEIVSAQAKKLALNEFPEIYILNGNFNAFVMKFARTKVLMLYSQVVETALTGNDDILKFVIGHELGHIKRKHLTKSKWLIFSLLVPLLDKAYSRGCEYTCDRIGYHFSKKGAIEGILILSTGKEVYSKINIDHFVNDSINSGSFWMWLSEKISTHPHTSQRLHEIRKYAQHC